MTEAVVIGRLTLTIEAEKEDGEISYRLGRLDAFGQYDDIDAH
jgi:hypothetical protein